jgi:hypothetical protein
LPPSQVQLAAAAALYNLSLDPLAHDQLLGQPPSGGEDPQQLGPASPLDSLLQLTESGDLMLAARAAGTLARCFKSPLRGAAVGSERRLAPLLALLKRCLAASPSAEQQQQLGRRQGGFEVDSAQAVAVDALCRALATLTQPRPAAQKQQALLTDGFPGSGGKTPEDQAVDLLIGLGATELLLAATKVLLPQKHRVGLPKSVKEDCLSLVTKATRESILGNAALCLGESD